jgi:hypothetical protein
MSAVSDVITYLTEQVNSTLPLSKPMPYTYLPEANDRVTENNFAIRVAGANFTEGTNSHLTIDHNFIVDLSRKYGLKKSSGDEDLRDKINLLAADIQLLYKTLARRRGSAGSTYIILISPVDVSEPNIDNDNNLVTLTLTLTIKYRVAT